MVISLIPPPAAMGLDIVCQAEDCPVVLFHGSYGTFHYFRIAVLRVLGFGDIFEQEDMYFDPAGLSDDKPLADLMSHSDCEGYLSPSECADLIPYFERAVPAFTGNEGPMQLHRVGDGSFIETPTGNQWKKHSQIFLDGLKHAAESGHMVSFC